MDKNEKYLVVSVIDDADGSDVAFHIFDAKNHVLGFIEDRHAEGYDPNKDSVIVMRGELVPVSLCTSASFPDE